MKKALIIAHTASMIYQFNLKNIEILQQLGYEITIACNFKEGNACDEKTVEKLRSILSENGVIYAQADFARRPRAVKNHIAAYKQIKKLLADDHYDIVHCHTPTGGVIGRLAARKYRATGTRVFYTAHGFHFYKGAPLVNWFLYYPAEKFCSHFTDVLITINSEDYELAKAKMHAKRVEYVPGVGIDVKKFSETRIDKSAKRREIGVPEDAFLILSVGELIPRKNHTVVIEAVARLIKVNKMDSIHYVICGQGILEQKLKLKVETLCVGRNVHFLGYRNDISEICKCCDLFVFPSKQEGLPVALMEAMACGLPVVCSNIRGNRDLVEDKIGGYLFGSSDVSELISAIIKMYNNRTGVKVMGDINSETIGRFKSEIVNEIMKGIYFGTQQI